MHALKNDYLYFSDVKSWPSGSCTGGNSCCSLINQCGEGEPPPKKNLSQKKALKEKATATGTATAWDAFNAEKTTATSGSEADLTQQMTAALIHSQVKKNLSCVFFPFNLGFSLSQHLPPGRAVVVETIVARAVTSARRVQVRTLTFTLHHQRIHFGHCCVSHCIAGWCTDVLCWKGL